MVSAHQGGKNAIFLSFTFFSLVSKFRSDILCWIVCQRVNSIWFGLKVCRQKMRHYVFCQIWKFATKKLFRFSYLKFHWSSIWSFYFLFESEEKNQLLQPQIHLKNQKRLNNMNLWTAGHHGKCEPHTHTHTSPSAQRTNTEPEEKKLEAASVKLNSTKRRFFLLLWLKFKQKY